MKAFSHKVSHYYQPSNTTCSPTALSILLSYYGDNIKPLDVEQEVPQSIGENGEKNGTINQQLATWCISRGYNVNLYTFDCQIIDQSWAELDNETLVARMKLRKNGWVVPSMGEQWTKEYTQSYIDFIEAGGTLTIKPGVTTKLLYSLLENGPFLPCISFSTLYASGRSVLDQKQDKKDDINGRATNHSIVVYGYEAGNFLLADPYKGLTKTEPELLLAAISTAQLECDNLLFQLTEKSVS